MWWLRTKRKLGVGGKTKAEQSLIDKSQPVFWMALLDVFEQ